MKFYNDTTATSPDATIVALSALGSSKKNIILLAGGADKKLDYKGLAKEIKKYTKALILFKGEASDKIKTNIRTSDVQMLVENILTMEEAVKIARENAKKGDIVLLSPGAASFGVFKNEFDRGDRFRGIIKNIK
ncbi:hypothetical protein HY249_02640 [Candidatus Azambacteria bacterium]|nr:hypothetical protein [Candidatus Azambacteria bacterium]